jgi:hypothetical protein
MGDGVHPSQWAKGGAQKSVRPAASLFSGAFLVLMLNRLGSLSHVGAATAQEWAVSLLETADFGFILRSDLLRRTRHYAAWEVF